jgi:hypothetical protein
VAEIPLQIRKRQVDGEDNESSVAGAIERHSSLASTSRPVEHRSSAPYGVVGVLGHRVHSPRKLRVDIGRSPPDALAAVVTDTAGFRAFATADRPRAQTTGGASGPIATIVVMDDADLIALRIPVALRGRAREILAITARSCAEHLDDEYAHVRPPACRAASSEAAVAFAARCTRIWAAGAIYAVGQVNSCSAPSSGTT